MKQEIEERLATRNSLSVCVETGAISDSVWVNKRRVIFGAGFLLLCAAWEALSRLGWINPIFFSSPSRFIATLFMLLTGSGPWEPSFWASKFWQRSHRWVARFCTVGCSPWRSHSSWRRYGLVRGGA